MSNTVTEPKAAFTEFNVQQDKGKPHFIRLHDSVVKRIEQGLRDHSGEALGLLFGSIDSSENCTIAVEEFEPASRIEDSIRKAGARKVVGYYRSYGASDFAPDATDRALFARCFPKEARLALLIKPPKPDVGTAMFFLGENGQLAAGRATVEFPFNLRELGAEDPAPATVVAPAPPPAQAPGKGPFLKIALALALVGGCFAVVNSVGIFQRQTSQPAVVEKSAAPAPAPVIAELPPVQPAESKPEVVVVKPKPPVVVPTLKKPVPAVEVSRVAPAPVVATQPPTVSAQQPTAPAPAPESRPAVVTTPVTAPPRQQQNIQPAPVSPPSVVPSPKAPEPVKPYIAPHAIRQFAPIVKDSTRRSITQEVIVRLKVNVDTTGRVISAAPLTRGNPIVEELAASAVTAVKRWEFEPARRGDEIIPGDVELSFTFRK